ncbi:erythromycin esterase family protein [Streptomyces sp. NBC_01260]|uniref:erythromycin esterase family protein n=1 Tax=unclassified Streptomyces TaxID=2593676 RepID=UPI000F54E811|nr:MULTISPECIES: erythromycin esterase family protein [unclassified Streptomyces]MCX4770322.1 erythromycin esterase family protein [Streptomyces sp. NBC_01285]RPK44814.1 Erythromycin esterase [Streptomyces sp. ADI92-24]
MVLPQLITELPRDVRVVALGEDAHNVTEFYELKDRILRYLVERHGFTAFVMESGFAEGLGVDAWLRGSPGEVADIAREGITYRFGECAPMHRQLEWMRSRGTGFYGMDLPGSSTSPGPAVRAVADRMPGWDLGELLGLSELGGRTEAAVRFAALSPPERNRLRTGLRALVARSAGVADAVVRRAAASVAAFLAELEPVPAGSPYPRDVFMAETVRWVLEREERIVVSAHNAHVRRTPFEGRPMMGGLLHEALGSELAVIALTCGSGPAIRFVERSPRPFDWDVLLEEREPTGPGAPGAEYDALIHLDHATLIPGAFERLRAEFQEYR